MQATDLPVKDEVVGYVPKLAYFCYTLKSRLCSFSSQKRVGLLLGRSIMRSKSRRFGMQPQ